MTHAGRDGSARHRRPGVLRAADVFLLVVNGLILVRVVIAAVRRDWVLVLVGLAVLGGGLGLVAAAWEWARVDRP